MSGVQILTILLMSFSNLPGPHVAHLQHNFFHRDAKRLLPHVRCCLYGPFGITCPIYLFPQSCELLEGRDHDLACVLFTQQLTPSLTNEPLNQHGITENILLVGA